MRDLILLNHVESPTFGGSSPAYGKFWGGVYTHQQCTEAKPFNQSVPQGLSSQPQREEIRDQGESFVHPWGSGYARRLW